MSAIPHSADEEIRCVGCAYELSRLPLSGKCPECGFSIELSIRGDFLAGRLPAYLTQLRRGALLVIVALNTFGVSCLLALLTSLAVVLELHRDQFIVGSLASISALGFAASFLLYVVGWWVIGGPDPAKSDPFVRKSVRCITILMLVFAVAFCVFMVLVIPMEMKRYSPNRPAAPPLFWPLGWILQWGNPVVWAAHYFTAALYIRRLSARIPNPRIYKLASILLWLGPTLMLISFFVVPGIIALALIYWLVAWTYEDMKQIATKQHNQTVI